ncbi:MAG: arginyltransferase [Alphaproteobacteria bacterium]|nr:arginyltransferase [Alphaproteobacteria bacterium]
MDLRNQISIDVPLEFRITRPVACPYLDGRMEQRLAADIDGFANQHDTLAKAGFRRVENWVYKPICAGCNACLPLRIPSGNGRAGGLTISRNQRRVLNRNRDLTRRILPNHSRADHYDLFARYLDSRHSDGQMAEMDEDSYTAMVSSSPIETVLVEYRLDDNPVAVMMLDLQHDGLSAVYSFFEPDLTDRSLGTFMVLDCAAIALEMDLPFLYLGYYIENSRKMSYKNRFQPAEVLRNGIWTAL